MLLKIKYIYIQISQYSLTNIPQNFKLNHIKQFKQFKT